MASENPAHIVAAYFVTMHRVPARDILAQVLPYLGLDASEPGSERELLASYLGDPTRSKIPGLANQERMGRLLALIAAVDHLFNVFTSAALNDELKEIEKDMRGDCDLQVQARASANELERRRRIRDRAPHIEQWHVLRRGLLSPEALVAFYPGRWAQMVSEPTQNA